MKLSPDASGKVEIAMINLPPYAPAETTSAPGAGSHFQV
jgi:hypothetical protein